MKHGIYSPPLLAEELSEIILALTERASRLEAKFASDGDEKAMRQGAGLRQLAYRLSLPQPTAKELT